MRKTHALVLPHLALAAPHVQTPYRPDHGGSGPISPHVAGPRYGGRDAGREHPMDEVNQPAFKRGFHGGEPVPVPLQVRYTLVRGAGLLVGHFPHPHHP